MKFDEAVFRTREGYRIIPYNRLSVIERKQLEGMIRCDGFGVLYPPEGQHAGICELDADTALLLHVLKEPGMLPDYLQQDFNEENCQRLSCLIIDGILEIKTTDGFVCGAAAASFLKTFNPAPTQRVSSLSHAATRYAAALQLADPARLAQRLYSYNTLPITPTWSDRLRNVSSFLRLDSVSGDWSVEDSQPGWFYLNKKGRRHQGSQVKLYISPHPDYLADVIPLTANAVGEAGCSTFKVGSTVNGILRPDKLVAYFNDIDSLQKAAAMLENSLSGLPAQGVPFTASLDAEGLLSWGADPVRQSDEQAVSWRQWIVEHLATSLARLVQNQPPKQQDIWHLALARLELDGIDPNSFKPTALWKNEFAK